MLDADEPCNPLRMPADHAAEQLIDVIASQHDGMSDPREDLASVAKAYHNRRLMSGVPNCEGYDIAKLSRKHHRWLLHACCLQW